MAIAIFYIVFYDESNKYITFLLEEEVKAAQISAYGNSSVVQINEVEEPSIGSEQVLINAYASSLNPFDTMVREGYVKNAIFSPFPFTLGGDIAGVVTQVGKNVSGLVVGDKVYGEANILSGASGAFAEEVAANEVRLAKMPENISFEEAAALPLVGIAALQALTRHIHLEKGQKIFIHGGAGGIGTVAIQIAKHIGAHVATTATGEGIAYVTKLGADEVIDYKTDDFTKLRDFDAVFDTVGGEDFTKTFEIVKEGSVVVSMLQAVNKEKGEEKGLTVVSQNTDVTTEMLVKLNELIDQGIVTAHIAKVFPLANIKEAFEAKESGGIFGKVVLKIK